MLDWIAEVTGAQSASRGGRIQSLWSGYGELFRVRLHGGPESSVVVKLVDPPADSGRGHMRKLRSYEVEMAWYRDYSARCGDACRVPRFIAGTHEGRRSVFVLEDLDAAGYPRRARGLAQLRGGLRWLAAFHATFLGERPRGLWKQGTYWHLKTRPDELAAMSDRALRSAAPKLDERLRRARFKTLVHGDAKFANFCFAPDGRVAAVDFQYVGGGCGMKDVAYLLSCMGSAELMASGRQHLDTYFALLRAELEARGHDADPVEEEWRLLYPLAVADFHRFFVGWAPGHGHDRYAARVTADVIRSL